MTDERLHTEEAIIHAFLEPLAAGYPGAFGLRDDCAAITPPPGMDLVVKTDPVRAGIHFLPDDPPADIAWKALAVNISDLVAKGAMPHVYLMALSFPEAPHRDWMTAFAKGLHEAQTAFGCQLIGGDTDRAPGPLSIDMTVIGTVPQGRMIRRAVARAGDIVFVSGTIGDAGIGLLLRSGDTAAARWPLAPAARTALIHRYRRPMPRLALIQPLRDFARASMDLSDGLIKDLDRMCRAAGVGADIELAKVPLSDAGRAVVTAEPDWLRRAVVAGDDYEVLCTVAPAHAADFQRAAEAAGVSVAAIGKISAVSGLRATNPSGVMMSFATAGWDHFTSHPATTER